nr:MAG TPA: hypothetical protein [Caudoviricetes sp.]
MMPSMLSENLMNVKRVDNQFISSFFYCQIIFSFIFYLLFNQYIINSIIF